MAGIRFSGHLLYTRCACCFSVHGPPYGHYALPKLPGQSEGVSDANEQDLDMLF